MNDYEYRIAQRAKELELGIKTVRSIWMSRAYRSRHAGGCWIPRRRIVKKCWRDRLKKLFDRRNI